MQYQSMGSYQLLYTTFIDGAFIKRTFSDLVRIDNTVYILGGSGKPVTAGDMPPDIDNVLKCDMSDDTPICNLESSMTLPVAGCVNAVAVGQVIYIVKEDTADYNFYAIYKYDLSSGIGWQKISQIPQNSGGRVCPKILTYNNLIYVLGGFYPNEILSVGYRISTFNLESETWQNYDNNLEINGGFCTAIAKDGQGNDKIYIIGGYGNAQQTKLTPSNFVRVLDPSTNAVVEYSNVLPIEVADSVCETINNKIYYFATADFNDTSNKYGTAGIYDATTKIATFIEDRSFPYLEQMSTEINNYMYLFGGTTDDDEGVFLDSIIKYYP